MLEEKADGAGSLVGAFAGRSPTYLHPIDES